VSRATGATRLSESACTGAGARAADDLHLLQPGARISYNAAPHVEGAAARVSCAAAFYGLEDAAMQSARDRAGRYRCATMFFGLLASAMMVARATTAADDQTSGWTAPPRAARRANPIQPDEHSRAAGSRLFLTHCASCHGRAGRGDGPGAIACNPSPSDLTDPAVISETDGELFWKISTGRKPMPAYESRLSDEQRWHVVNFLHAIVPPPATQPAERHGR